MALDCSRHRKPNRHVVFCSLKKHFLLCELLSTFLNFFLCFELQSWIAFALVAGVWTVQSLQRQNAHLPQVCWVCVPRPGVWGFVQVCVRCRVRGWWLPVWWGLWSGWLAQQQINLQTECNLSLSKGKMTKKIKILIGWQCSGWMQFH